MAKILCFQVLIECSLKCFFPKAQSKSKMEEGPEHLIFMVSVYMMNLMASLFFSEIISIMFFSSIHH